jgi:adenylyltransferase/sulfurtransferase
MPADKPIAFQEPPESRFDRHALISWWDQERLARARVIVAGAGALGNEVLKLLALVGVGEITLVDFDRVSPSNLARTVLFGPEDIGRPKVEAAAEKLKKLNPEVQIRPVNGDLRFDLSLSDYRSADIVIGCLDSVNARWALNRKCRLAGVEWIDGGISDHHGLVARYSPSSGACYECNFTAQTLERFNRRYSCPYGLVSAQAGAPVPTTAVTTSAIAAIQVQQALLWLHQVEQDALRPGERVLLYLKPFGMVKDLLPYNPDCLAHQGLPREVPTLPCTHRNTVAEVLAAARTLYPGVTALELPYDLVIGFSCPACGHEEAVNRPKERVLQEESRCPGCGGSRVPQITTCLNGGALDGHLRLEEIGVPAGEILFFRQNSEHMFAKLM